jgi:DNA adenine methylase
MTYPGGKAGDGVFQSIINLMPPHKAYIEPFVGSGAILRIKLPAERNIGVDLDPEVIRWWRSGDAAGAPAIFGSKVRASKLPAGTARSHVPRRQAMPDPAMQPGRSPIANSRVAVPTIVHGDGIQFLRSYPFTASDLVYCDPPYLLSTRPSGARYACEMTDAQHQELLDVLNHLPCMAMISGYSSVLYARELKTWNAYSFAAATRGKPAAEWVWCNFPRPVELHDYRFAGATYREREKLKRRQVTWERKLERMSPIERQILKSALQHF